MRNMISSHPVWSFFIVACGFSWLLWALMIASQHGWLPFKFPTNPLGSFGPAFSAILLTGISAGRKGVRVLLKPLFSIRTGYQWIIFCLLFPIAVSLFCLAVHSLFSHNMPSPQNLDQYYMVPLLFVVVLVLGGPLGEEIGWRGYALPRLLESKTAFTSSMLITVMWVIWHIPLFWLEGADQEGSSLVLFALAVAAFSLFFTWIYIHTRGSLFTVMLFHTSINLTSVLLAEIFPEIERNPAYHVIFTIAILITAGILVSVKRWNLTVRDVETPKRYDTQKNSEVF